MTVKDLEESHAALKEQVTELSLNMVKFQTEILAAVSKSQEHTDTAIQIAVAKAQEQTFALLQTLFQKQPHFGENLAKVQVEFTAAVTKASSEHQQQIQNYMSPESIKAETPIVLAAPSQIELSLAPLAHKTSQAANKEANVESMQTVDDLDLVEPNALTCPSLFNTFVPCNDQPWRLGIYDHDIQHFVRAHTYVSIPRRPTIILQPVRPTALQSNPDPRSLAYCRRPP